MRLLQNMLLMPIVTEKAVRGRAERVYVFKVRGDATKVDIKNAVSKLFNVKVLDVNTVSVRGKRRGAIRGRIGATKSFKKAYVKLSVGQKIESLEA